jgi:hypothetical protein
MQFATSICSGAIFALLAACAETPLASLPPRTTVTSVEQEFLDTDFELIGSVVQLPFQLRSLITPPPYRIAEPSQPYNYTDNGPETDLYYRLVVAGRSDGMAFAVFDGGGYGGPTQHLLMAHISGDNVTDFCRFTVVHPVGSLEQVKAAIPAGLRAARGYRCR